jgi:hypothetical protein
VLPLFSRSHDHLYPKSLSQTITVDIHGEARVKIQFIKIDGFIKLRQDSSRRLSMRCTTMSATSSEEANQATKETCSSAANQRGACMRPCLSGRSACGLAVLWKVSSGGDEFQERKSTLSSCMSCQGRLPFPNSIKFLY